MSIDARLVGKDGNLVNVTDGALDTVLHDHPPKLEKELLLPFRQFIANAAGSTDMLVNGSSTSQLFYIEANADYDIWIKTLAFTIADAGASLNEFGNISALSAGCSLEWKSKELGDVVIGDSLKSNFDFVQMADFNPSFGTGNAAFRATNVESTSEAYVPQLNFATAFGFRWGIPLLKGTKDRLCFTINDNVSGIDRFDAVAKGVKI